MRAIASLLRPTRERGPYLSLLFLASRTWVGLCYLGLLVGLLTAAGTLAVGVGLAILVLVLLAARACIAFEREIGRSWLGVELRPMSSPWSSGGSLWQRSLALFRDGTTWKGIAYLLLQLPLGAIALAILSACLCAAVGLAAAPLLYVLDAGPTGGPGVYSSLWLEGGPTTLDPIRLAALAVLVPAGAAVAVGTLHLAAAGGRAWGRLAEGLLGLSVAQVQLGTAQAEAAAEHARAERSEQSRRELIVNVSHELRTPIASIRGHVESLLDGRGAPSEAERQHYLEVVAREAERLGFLVDDLLAVARADAGELTLHLAPVALDEVVEHVHAALAPIARSDRQVTLVRTPAPPLPPARADRDRLGQVLMNLVRNAILYTPEGGMVAIELSQSPDGRLALAVEDTGVGIPPGDLERIFERFYRTDASRSRSTGGFGLGLSISRELVEAMGGTMTVESEPGRGSRFTVHLLEA